MDYKVKLSDIKNSTTITGITSNSINFILYNLILENNFNFVTLIVNNNFELELTKNEIEFYSKNNNINLEIMKFPEWNTIPYDVNSPQIKIQTERIKTIYNLINYKKTNENLNNKRILLLISKNSIIQKFINVEDFEFINFFVGEQISIPQIENILKVNNYEISNTSLGLGNYSINNNIIDIVTFENKNYRIFIVDNIIREIKSFDLNTQLTFNKFDNILILPIREIIFNFKNIQNFKQNYRRFFGITNEEDDLYKNISNGIFHNGSENWLPMFYNKNLNSIFELIPSNSIISYNHNIENKILEYSNQILKYYNLRLEDIKINKAKYNPINPDSLYLKYSEFENLIMNYINIIFDVDNNTKDLNDLRKINLNFKKIPNFFKDSKEVFKTVKEFLIG